MPSKQAIIDNIEEYTAVQLVDYIKDGIVTFEELCEETEGYFSASVRREVKQLLAGSEEDEWLKASTSNSKEVLLTYLQTYPESIHREEAREMISALEEEAQFAGSESEWDAIDKEDIAALKQFCLNHPSDDPRVIEARKLINQLQREAFLGFDIDALKQKVNDILTDSLVADKDAKIFETIKEYIRRKRVSISDVMSVIAQDHNFLRASVIEKMIDEGLISYDDLVSIGIERAFIAHLARGEKKQSFSTPRKLDMINKVCTEVYFWGIPSSGKSCAIGAILSIANNGEIARSMSKDNDCQGYGYMTRLAQLFRNDGSVGTLPEGTSIFSTYEMGFDLEDEKGQIHPITFIDLAGELVRCMYKSDANEPLSDDDMEALDTLTNILIDNRTKNRKIHFFVLEYGGEKRKYEGLSQTDYLDGALRYIERTGVFKDDTDAIYLMFTKVDKAGVTGTALVQVLQEYTEKNYKGFYQGLERICRDKEINGGKVERIPFTLGQVCFQDYCLFDGRAASNVVKKLLVRSKGFKNGKLQRGLNIFKR
ncbi:MAG: hypothetical protein SOV24_05200 [Muribaculaceae bacterium]|nr:hypothetical protein [Bacteroidales bacterium]MDY2733745.1 hypothetical protein [Muribaculaceae bacterium]MDY4650178.1 hypothetical protein [Muribaculaceae bacterium]MDY5387407.1 hypothetical protein [Muribaculaceae bacterium]